MEVGYIIFSITMYCVILVYKLRKQTQKAPPTQIPSKCYEQDIAKMEKAKMSKEYIAKIEKAKMLEEHIAKNVCIKNLKTYFRIYKGMSRNEIVCYICGGKYSPRVWDGFAAREFIYKHCACIKRNTGR